MEPMEAAQARSVTCGDTETTTEFHSQLGEELNLLISVPHETSTSSFTALLGLPSNQAMELLVQAHNEPPVTAETPLHTVSPPPIFPNDTTLVDRASKFPTLTNMDWVKQEPEESNSDPNSPAFSNDPDPKPATKRKEREKKGKESIKKSKKGANIEKTEEGGEKLPYVHVRARRGQATDSHSLAERARREKINARMKLLQELVPGCNKISGTAMVLDEIINHVQSLQRQVEFLSMRLAAVNPRIDFNLDTLMAAESGSTSESNYQTVTTMPPVWAEGHHMQANSQEFQQQWYSNGLDHHSVLSREEENSIFITQDNSLRSYDSWGNPVPLHSNKLKMEM